MTRLEYKGYVGTAELSEPDRPFKGLFNVRTRPEVHRAYAQLAARKGKSLNEVVTDALERALPTLQRGSK